MMFHTVRGVTLLLYMVSICSGKNVSMKIITEPASYGFINNLPSLDKEEHRLVPRVHPSNFSGPSQFKMLWGKCYNFTSQLYRYTLCPFFNLTQYELSYRWNAYHGILGIWHEWKIDNYTFVAMRYTKGDECGASERSAEVIFQCGPRNKLMNVTEPEKCYYVATFMTPLVCHPDAMLVYPRLPKHLQLAWDILETELSEGDITEKGYMRRQRELFEEAGFQVSHEVMLKPSKQVSSSKDPSLPYTDLGECNDGYNELKEELEELKKELEGMKVLLDLRNVKVEREQEIIDLF